MNNPSAYEIATPMLKAKQAMLHCIQHKTDVKNAMYRDDIGWIDFVWGTTGEIKPNGKTKGAKGIAHIIEARMRKDEMTKKQAENFVINAVIKTLMRGNLEIVAQKESVTKLKISHKRTVVHLVKAKDENAWVLTGFEMYQTMNQVGGATNPDLCTTSPIRSRADVGASDNTQYSKSKKHSQFDFINLDLVNVNKLFNLL